MSRSAIGGYFELELGREHGHRFADARRYQSGRAAFFALLSNARPSRVWMPRYICDTMYAPLSELGIEYITYSIDSTFNMADPIGVRPGDWIYYVNYFGVCEPNISRLLRRFDPRQIVLDNCQAFFAQPRECLATIYSPRKFFGVPDGGLVRTTVALPVPPEGDSASRARAEHLLDRLAGTPESGYGPYLIAEASLNDLEPRHMSTLTERILNSVCYEEVRERRTDNFRFLHDRLGRWNKCEIDLSNVDGPLCYPFMTDQSGLREELIKSRIFVATYWRDVSERCAEDTYEAVLARQLIPLPCDQRYGVAEMNRVVETCIGFLNRWDGR